MEKKRAVTILLQNEDGDILGVSRKNDHNDIGLPGGKCEEGETDVQAIIRETKEETGLDVYDVRPYFERHDDEYICTTFIGNYKGKISTSENGRVVWTDWKILKKGSFGEYNERLEEHFNKFHKYDIGYILLNPGTSETFLILKALNKEASFGTEYDFGAEAGYLVRALFSEHGYSFVKKSALDNVHMIYVHSDSHTNDEDIQALGFKAVSKTSGQAFACKSHFDVNQYYDDFLYSYHLKKVVDVGKRFKHLIPEEDWQHVEDGLWNHDVIEDARKTFNDVKKIIGEKGANISFALTNSDGITRDERADEKYYKKIVSTQYATFAKLCDRIANMEYSYKTESSMYKKYKNELENFKNKLYVVGEYEEMWEHLTFYI